MLNSMCWIVEIERIKASNKVPLNNRVFNFVHNYQNVSVRVCESAIAHVRAVISVRKGCGASWNCACESACVWGYLWPIAHVRSHLNSVIESWKNIPSCSEMKKKESKIYFLKKCPKLLQNEKKIQNLFFKKISQVAPKWKKKNPKCIL